MIVNGLTLEDWAQPEERDLLRFADDGGRIPENDRALPYRIGATLRIRMPQNWNL